MQLFYFTCMWYKSGIDYPVCVPSRIRHLYGVVHFMQQYTSPDPYHRFFYNSSRQNILYNGASFLLLTIAVVLGIQILPATSTSTFSNFAYKTAPASALDRDRQSNRFLLVPILSLLFCTRPHQVCMFFFLLFF